VHDGAVQHGWQVARWFKQYPHWQ